jgi:putative ABC transport system permease protein
MGHRLSILYLAGQNLGRKPFRTAMLGLTAAVVAAVLFGGTLLVQSMQRGLDSMAGRLGADVLVVPRGYESTMKEVLLSGEPSSFYMDRQVLTDVASLPGVARTSPQLYIASLSAACCTVPVQLIGFDPTSDFSIRPWLANTIRRPLGPGEIIAGHLIVAEVGDELQFFGQPFHVVGQLERTGMGLDAAVLMSLDSAYEMAQRSETKAVRPAGVGTNQLSCVLLKLDPGADSLALSANITRLHPDTDVIVSSRMMQDIADRLRGLLPLVYGLASLLWLMSTCVLVAVFSMIVNERRRELGLLRAMGATRWRVFALIVSEAALLTGSGALAGILAASLVIFPFRDLIAGRLGLPYLYPPAGEIAALVLLSLAATLLLGPLASLYSAVSASKTEPYATIRDGE